MRRPLKHETIQARVHRLQATRVELASMRAQGADLVTCARLSRSIDHQERELKLEQTRVAAITPEERAATEAARQARIQKYMDQLTRARKPREGGDA